MTPISFAFHKYFVIKTTFEGGQTFLESIKTQPARPPSGRIAHPFQGGRKLAILLPQLLTAIV
ncbi:MAG: hypothetical protein LBK82_04135 [Planctomycetaceae bacterium]|nr:hypothetical protein [Planctomycetaceae bacterium]